MLRDFPLAGFVLVGGQSRRMGQDKALLEVKGRPLLLRTVDVLRPQVDEVTLLGSRSRYSHFGLPVLEDLYATQCPLAGLCTGLKVSACDWNLFLACDLPFLEGSILDVLVERVSSTRAQAIVPKFGDKWQPLCAAYHRSCLPVMELALKRGDLPIVGVLPSLQVEALGPSAFEDLQHWETMFCNVNTVQQWEEVLRKSSSCD
jgi:molybdenum cofactor guanylyltransferase